MVRSQEETDALFNDERAEQLTTDIHTFEVEGDTVIGCVVKVEEFQGGEFDTVVNKYTLKTDGGTCTCVLGSAADTQLKEAGKLPGRVIGIRYLGKKKLRDGKQVNKFDIRDLSKMVKIP